MPASTVRYCAAGIYWAHTPDKIQLLSTEDENGKRKVIVFDTLTMAQWVLPRLGGGRLYAWDADEETCYWTPLNPTGFNRACIITNYDPYDVPADLLAMGIRSEAVGRDWRYHLIYFEKTKELCRWADEFNAHPQLPSDTGLPE